MIKHHKILLTFLIINCAFLIAPAQNPDIKRTYNWNFGNAAVNFSSGAPVANTNSQMNSDNSATISDTAGNLLFYTDGRTVWNRNHLVMPNGTGLSGDAYGRVLIVPQPMNNNIYYVFTTQVNPAPYTGFLHSIVDMSLQGGLGDVIIKNDTILKDSWEKLAAVKHANGKDVWIVVNKIYTNSIYCYLLTATGFDTSNHVINNIGMVDNNGMYNTKFSASGKKYVNPHTDTVQVFDFNTSTGILSNPTNITNTTYTNNGTFYSNNTSQLCCGVWLVL